MMINRVTFTVCCAITMATLFPAAVVRSQDEDENAGAAAGEGQVAASEQVKPAIELGAPFCDNAVLQREMSVPVWGWSKPGTIVTVKFSGQEKKATAGADGKWIARLDPLEASLTPAEMVISDSEGKTVTLRNILVGEVWMASGQSNMQYKVGGKGINTIKLAMQFMEQVKDPVIREFEVTSVYSMLHPIEKATGSWKNGDYPEYSAIAFAFAHKLYTQLNVPIGILNCSFSQTAIQAWVPRQGFATGEDEYTKAIHRKCLETDPGTPEHKAAWDAFYKSLEDQVAANEARISKGEKARPISAKVPGNMSDNRDANWMYNGRLNPVVPYALRGAIWNQGYANMGEGLPYYNNLHSLIRGWRIAWDRPDLPVYFHQFYCPGKPSEPSIGSTSEMRLGTWMARDIPNAGMASQIDISGGIHYSNKTVPGQRLALHALKNQYGKAVVAEGPMFKAYEVKGDTVIVKFEGAEGGLVVADTEFNRSSAEGATGFADPMVIENGEGRVRLFWLAGEDRVWHPASFVIKGDEVIVKSDAVRNPRGISYGSGGIGFQPCLYNKALLPMTPFIYFDNKMVTSKEWPGGRLEIAGEVVDPNTVGLRSEWNKMPLMSVQFCDDAVFQADKPVTIWGSTQMYGEWGGPAEGEGVVHFEFGDIKKTIPVTEGMDEWSVTLPPMKAGAEPHTLKVSFTLNGELAHERVVTNIVFGDVWYVAAPPSKFTIPNIPDSGKIVRMIQNESKRGGHGSPSRFSVCVSRGPRPDNRFASYWRPAEGLAGAIGHSIAAKTGRPVGIIFMQSKATGEKGKPSVDPSTIGHWIAPEFLKDAPSLMDAYKTVGSQYPGNPYYLANVKRYIADWKKHWEVYIPEMIATKAVPDGRPWGTYPSPRPFIGDSQATQIYNIYVHCFSPAAVKGVVFLTGEGMVKEGEGANFGPEMTALAKSFKSRLGDPDAEFIYTVPGKTLAPRITVTGAIQGKSLGVEIADWTDVTTLIDSILKAAN